jgi:hypothetical protein
LTKDNVAGVPRPSVKGVAKFNFRGMWPIRNYLEQRRGPHSTPMSSSYQLSVRDDPKKLIETAGTTLRPQPPENTAKIVCATFRG